MRKIAAIICFIIFFLTNINTAKADYNCDNRYLNLVNPVRGRELWFDKNINSFDSQYSIVSKYNFSATWLLQYDVFSDKELMTKIRSTDQKQERGVFLEISKKLADEAGVVYPINTPWYSPKAVFLSGYSQSDRIKLINQLFRNFKTEFGNYPKSVGAWWIDSFSLNYLKEKYNIKAAMIVADQKTTDSYGVWGQWWSVPYYPSKANILTPATSLNDKQNVTIIQWAQRDPTLAISEGKKSSNYSLQANDYIQQGKNTEYFKALFPIYLDCQNPIGQITIGLETGMESVGYIKEYDNQILTLSQVEKLKSVTMSQFADIYAKTNPGFATEWKISYKKTNISMTTKKRENDLTKEIINYSSNISFSDYFLPDKNDFLDRRLPSKTNQKEKKNLTAIILIAIAISALLAIKFKMFSKWLIGILFTVSAFWPILRSYYQFGWKVFYGPAVQNLPLIKIILVFSSIGLVILISKLKFFKIQKNKWILWLLPLSFGLDILIQSIRFSMLSGLYYVGFLINHFTFAGLKFGKPFHLEFVNIKMPSYITESMLHVDFTKLNDNLFMSLISYPLIHVALALTTGFLINKLPKPIKRISIAILIILFVWYILTIFQSYPIKAIPIN